MSNILIQNLRYSIGTVSKEYNIATENKRYNIGCENKRYSIGVENKRYNIGIELIDITSSKFPYVFDFALS